VAELERATDLREYREMQAEAERLAELLTEEIAAEQESTQVKGAVLAYPVNAPITSPYGYRYHPILHYRKLHTGVDFGASEGTLVWASRGGEVIQSEYNSAYGNRVVISHGYVNGVHLATTYNHMSSRSVSVGDQVETGDVVGLVGSTGYSTGPHLHFEVLVNGEFVDPMDWP
jgi:murein DD-endopeptidase MepM/ murein hydrolase activator NlpD